MNRFKDFKPDTKDFIIVIMGPTGSGKTNFINVLTGNAAKAKAANLGSATQNVTPHPMSYHGVRLVLVDTPGFDDTYRSDMEILRLISDWLTKKYPDGDTLRLAGVIYLHRITDNRMSGSAYKNLHMFGNLCGNLPLPRVRLVTTMWDMAKEQAVTQRRENELANDFWRELINGGAIVKRFENNTRSASRIVDDLIDKNLERDELLLQEELVKHRKHLNETEAGKALCSRLQKILTEQTKTLKELAEEARLQNDPTLARSLQEEYDQVNALLQKTFDEMKAMKISLSRRFILWLFAGKSRGRVVKVGFAD